MARTRSKAMLKQRKRLNVIRGLVRGGYRLREGYGSPEYKQFVEEEATRKAQEAQKPQEDIAKYNRSSRGRKKVKGIV